MVSALSGMGKSVILLLLCADTSIVYCADTRQRLTSQDIDKPHPVTPLFSRQSWDHMFPAPSSTRPRLLSRASFPEATVFLSFSGHLLLHWKKSAKSPPPILCYVWTLVFLFSFVCYYYCCCWLLLLERGKKRHRELPFVGSLKKCLQWLSSGNVGIRFHMGNRDPTT